MSSLREVKDRIASVRSTLKITSAMKLVASSKLRRAQRSIEALRPYADTLSEILATASGVTVAARDAFEGTEMPATSVLASLRPSNAGLSSPSSAVSRAAIEESVILSEHSESKNLVILAFSSNSSMCGAFNANVIKKALEVARSSEWNVELWAFGRKMSEAFRKEGHPATHDYSDIVAHSSFDAVAKVAEELRTLLQTGVISGAVLVYNHFVSTGKQQVVVEPYLTAKAAVAEDLDNQEDADFACMQDDADKNANILNNMELVSSTPNCTLEPSAQELLEALMPQVLDLKLYAALLDSAASEHAARMIAMQTATDNAEELLSSLTLEYNKGRQQKITSEILDLVGAEA